MKNKSLIILIILILLFFGLIFYSTTKINTSISYNFFDVNFTLNTETSYAKIGEVKLTNNKPIPTRFQLKKLIGCAYQKKHINTYYDTQYVGNEDRKQYYDFLSGRYNNMIAEVGGGETQLLDINIYVNEPLTIKNVKTNKSFYLYIFENNFETVPYAFCRTVDKNKAISHIFMALTSK